MTKPIVHVSGIGVLGAAFLIMFALKLAGVGIAANLSWWVVFVPLWLPLAFIAVILVIAFVYHLVVEFSKR